MSRDALGRVVVGAIVAVVVVVSGVVPAAGASATPGASSRSTARHRPSAPVPVSATQPPPSPPGSGRWVALDKGLRLPEFDHHPTPATRRAAADRSLQGFVRSPAPADQTSPAQPRANQSTPSVTVQGARSTFVVTFTGFDQAQPAENAFLDALRTWADQVYSTVPITVDAYWTDLGATTGILGAAGPNNMETSGTGSGATLYPVALANSLAGRDLDTANTDIGADFNSQYADWSFSGQPPTGKEDFQSVATHELAHGLGFFSDFSAGAGGDTSGCPTGHGCYAVPATSSAPVPVIFDRFASTGQSGPNLISLGNNTAALYRAETSNDVYWSGHWGDAIDGGMRPELYFPAEWSPGSSASHLDEFAYGQASGNALMTPYLDPGEVERVPGPITVGMMLDIGWSHLAPNEAFTRAAYQDFLGREPTADELRFSLAYLQGGSRYQIALGLTKTTEWLDVIFRGFYENTLGREPSRGELDDWEALIRNGSQTITTAGASFYASDEYFQTKAGSDLETWVGDLYSAILHRAASSSERQYWANLAASGGRHGVALEIYQSTESRESRVRALYVKLLDRQPDPAGLSGWADALLHEDDLVLAANLAGSYEYLLRAEFRYLTF